MIDDDEIAKDGEVSLLSRSARQAALLIPTFATLLDIGPGNPALQKCLPEGCTYTHCSPDDLPDAGNVDVAMMFGLLEACGDPLALLRNVRALDIPLILAYPLAGPVDRNGLTKLMTDAGFRLHSAERIDASHELFKWIPDRDAMTASAASLKKVLVLSYFKYRNFGDRLGYHVVNSLMPAGTQVTHAPLNPWVEVDQDYDMVIVGLGSSLNAPAIARPQLHRLIERTPHSLGIFGTQYRYQYERMANPALFGALLDRLTCWWARYEEDISAFGGGRDNVRHLGDWLISAFPMTRPTLDKGLAIPANVMDKELSLDRVIQQIQAYRRVTTARIHPMLCALTSADEIMFHEQREGSDKSRDSGKFRAQLYDIFGRTYEEGSFFTVDRDAVLSYKLKVEANMAALRAQIAALLGVS